MHGIHFYFATSDVARRSPSEQVSNSLHAHVLPSVGSLKKKQNKYSMSIYYELGNGGSKSHNPRKPAISCARQTDEQIILV